MTERNKKQIRFRVQQQADKEPTQAQIQYGEFVFKTQSVKSFRLSMTALRAVQRQIRTLLTYAIYRNLEYSSLNVRPWNRDKTCCGDWHEAANLLPRQTFHLPVTENNDDNDD